MKMHYYAAAKNERGQIAQMLVTRENGRKVSEEWTGVVYKTQREAEANLEQVNTAIFQNGTYQERGN